MSRVARAVALTALTLCCAAAAVGCGVVDRPVSGVRVDQVVYVPLTEDSFAEAASAASTRHDTFHLEVSSPLLSMDVDVRLGPDDEVELAGTMTEGSSPPGTVVAVDGEVYVRAQGTRVYYELPDDLAKQMRAAIRVTRPMTQADDFEAAIESLEYVGVYDVEYGAAHRYDISLDKRFVAENTGVPIDQVPDISYRMWLDDSHLLHRFTTTVLGSVADGTYSAWGDPVEIERPPRRLVEPLPMPTEEA